jgi:hypothetical protein
MTQKTTYDNILDMEYVKRVLKRAKSASNLLSSAYRYISAARGQGNTRALAKSGATIICSTQKVARTESRAHHCKTTYLQACDTAPMSKGNYVFDNGTILSLINYSTQSIAEQSKLIQKLTHLKDNQDRLFATQATKDCAIQAYNAIQHVRHYGFFARLKFIFMGKSKELEQNEVQLRKLIAAINA